MFLHKGKTRTLSQNLKIASLLSFVAGLVNVTGLLAINRLTTNVTEYFAFFVDEVFKLYIADSLIFSLYILFFFFGSYVSILLIEIISRKNERYVFVVLTIIETLILLSLSFCGAGFISTAPDLIAFSLLFAMSLQNSLVTRISGAMMRTAFLTGLFTDLGIEISRLFFYTIKEQRNKLISTIKLRFTIILSFFAGGVLRGIF